MRPIVADVRAAKKPIQCFGHQIDLVGADLATRGARFTEKSSGSLASSLALAARSLCLLITNKTDDEL